ncbi:MAG: tetratricopeptide repeat protein [Phenylobacterium sp.]|uniref:tetratricopeptide repeat protein n=1 Tax=Phenylobacterium sp. TaxID=1871053 RepID=UPI00391ABFF0
MRAASIAILALMLASNAAAAPNPDYLVNRAALLVQRGELDAARADLDEAIRFAPSLAVAYNNRAAIHEKQGRPQAAMSDLDEAIRLDPKLASAHMNRGNIFLNAGDPERAVADYRQALALNPRHVWTLVNLAVAESKLGRHDEALAHLDHAFRLKKDPAILHRRGHVLIEKGEPQAALEPLTRAIGMLRSYGKAYATRGDAHLDLHDFSRAVGDYQKAVDLGEENAELLNGLCWSRTLAGEGLELARPACDRALALQADSPDILSSRAHLLLRLAASEEALADAERALALAPDHLDSLLLRGVARLRLGRSAEGQADIARALSLDPKLHDIYAKGGLAEDLRPFAPASSP